MHWRKDRPPTPIFLGCPCGSAGKESTCNEGDLGSIPGLGRSPGEGKGYPLQYAGLENSMDYIVHELQRVKNDWATFTFTFLNLGYLVFFNLQTTTTTITKAIFCHSDYLPFAAKLLYNLDPPSPPQSSSLRFTWDAVFQT